ERLLEHQSHFDKLLKMIPTKYYLSTLEKSDNSKYQKNKKNKKEIKILAKNAKFTKLDPEGQKSILDIQKSTLLEKKNEKEEIKEDENNIIVNNTNQEKKIIKPMSNISSTEARLKLQSRIAELRKNRRATQLPNSPLEKEGENLKTARSRAEILERRQKKLDERKNKKKLKSNSNKGGNVIDVNANLVENTKTPKKRKVEDTVLDEKQIKDDIR
ncbi:hypothetical protein HK099_003319, partial [Clydaea vesicula]